MEKQQGPEASYSAPSSAQNK